MTGVTSKGFIGKTTEQYINDVTNRANSEEYFGANFPTTPQSPFHVHTGILAQSFVSLTDLVQAVADQQNRDTATGVYLDYLARLIGLERREASGSVGDLWFTCTEGTTIARYFPSADNQKRNVLTQESVSASRANAYSSTFKVALVENSSAYTINIENTPYTYNSDADATEEEILTGLVTALDTGKSIFTTTRIDNTIQIVNNTRANTLTSTNSSNLSLVSTGVLVSSEAAELGALEFPANTITTLVGANPSILSVTNPLEFTVGRLRETDEELRQRMAEREQSTGTATVPAIEASISEISGVTSAKVKENDTLVVDSLGIPPKSYEVFVTGGDEDSIAKVIWTTKPAGISTYGKIKKIVIGNDGEEYAVYFSRNDVEYAWQKVTYKIVDPSLYPNNADDLIKSSVTDLGNSLKEGEDYTANRFYGVIYSKVQGIEVQNIEIAVTTNEGDTPTYSTTTIPVSDTTTLVFDPSRVEITT